MQLHRVDTDMMLMDSSRGLMTIRAMTIRRGMIMGMITLLMALDSTIMVDPKLVVDMVVPRLVVGMAARRLVGMVDRMQGMRTRMLEAGTSIKDMTTMVMLVDKTSVFSFFVLYTPSPRLVVHPLILPIFSYHIYHLHLRTYTCSSVFAS